MQKYRIRRVRILSVAYWCAIVSFATMAILLVPYGIIMTIAKAEGRIPIELPTISLVMMPFIYGVVGFLAGALLAVIYNFLAGFIGGIELEIDGDLSSPNILQQGRNNLDLLDPLVDL